MKVFFNAIITFSLSYLMISCAASMTPMEVNTNLPTLTKTKFVSQSAIDSLINLNKCQFLNKDRYYVAPIGLTNKDDLKNGAKGIDDWVQLDGGNAYLLKNFRWNTVDVNGSTQLHLDFSTLLCN